MITIHEKVAEQIAGRNAKVEESVIEIMAQRELSKRADALVQCLDTLADLEKKFKRLKPDQVFLSDDGKEESASWSKDGYEARKKAQERIAKYHRAIDKALTAGGDYGDVNNLNNNKDKDEGRGGSPS